MTDNYFVDTASLAVGAGGGDPDGGTRDALAHAAGGGNDGATSDDGRGGSSFEDDAQAELASGGDGARDARQGDDAADGPTVATRDAAGDVVAGGTTIFAANFENDALAAIPGGWARVGGSAADWGVAVDSSQVLAQAKSPSTTLRVCYAPASAGWAASLSARVKVTQNGSSGTTTAMLCLRFVVSDGSYQCLALEPGVGVQIKTNLGDGPVWPGTISLGAWYGLRVATDNSGLLSAWLQGAFLGTFRPSAPVAGGSIAVATQSAEAEFDDVTLTAP